MVCLTRKIAVCVCAAGLFLSLWSASSARAGGPPILREIEVSNTSKFVRIRFLFQEKVPQRTGAYLRNDTLVLLFAGARQALPRKVVPVEKGVVKDIVIHSLPKGIKVVLKLRGSGVEYVKYQRRRPPQVVVSLRKAKGGSGLKERGKGAPPHEVKKATPPSRVASVSKPLESKKKRAEKKGGIDKKDSKAQKEEAGKIGRQEGVSHQKPEEERERVRSAEGETQGAMRREESGVSASTLPAAKDPAIRALFVKAKETFDKGRYREAAKLFRRVMKKTPKTREGEESAYYWVKSLYLSGGQGGKGAIKVSEAYKKILESYPKAPWAPVAFTDLMYLYKTLGFYNQAIEVAQQILQRYPGSHGEEAAFVLGRLQLLKQSFAEAEKSFRAYLSKYPKGKFAREATYSLGDALYYQGDVKRAVTVYQEALQRWPQATATDFKTLENMAAIFEKSGQYERALDLMFMALNLSTSEERKAKLMLKIASLYERMKRYREALKVYSKVIAQYSKTREEVIAMVRMAELAQLHPGIRYKGFNYGPDPYVFPLQAYEKILKERKDPFAVKKALLQKGKLLMEKDPEKAVAAFMKLIQTYPNSPEAKEARKLSTRAFVLLMAQYEKKGRFKRCIEAYRRYQKAGLERNPLLALHAFGCFLQKGAIQSAEKVLAQVNRAELPAAMRELYDYDVLSLAFHKEAYKEVVRRAIAFLKQYPTTGKEKSVMNLLRVAFARLNGGKEDSFIGSSLRELLTLPGRVSERQGMEDFFITHVKGLSLRGKEKEALALVTWYLKTFPRSPTRPRMSQVLGDLSYRMGMYRQAEEAYSAALKGAFPREQRAYLHYRVALCLMRQKRYEEAWEAFEEAGKIIKPGKSAKASEGIMWLQREIALQKAELLFVRGKTKEAIKAYQAFIGEAPSGQQRDWALYRLGALYEAVGDLEKVKKTYETLGARASDAFWKRNAEDFKVTTGWFVQHARELRAIDKGR